MNSQCNEIEATIAGNVSGQVAVGRHILQIGSIHGGSVIVNAAELQAAYVKRSRPLRKLPRPFDQLIGRAVELGQAQSALEAGESVELYGEPGCGKSVLLRTLAHRLSSAANFPDGVIYVAAGPRPISDRLELLFNAFYDPRPDFKPTEAQVRSLLEEQRALIVFDDRQLDGDDRKALLGILPHSTFAFGAYARHLWNETRALAVRGLPIDDAIALLERALERPLTGEERAAARSICARLEGHPLGVLQFAGKLREDRTSLADVEPVLADLRAPLRAVLSMFACVGGLSLSRHAAAESVGISPESAIFTELKRRVLIEDDGERYRISNGLAKIVEREWDLTPWRDRLINYFAGAIPTNREQRTATVRDASVLSRLVDWTATAGRWRDGLRLARAGAAMLALAKYWGTWDHVLERAVMCAQALGDRSAQAWALHERGIRAVCLGEPVAEAFLSEALALRKSLGETAAAALTQQNLFHAALPHVVSAHAAPAGAESSHTTAAGAGSSHATAATGAAAAKAVTAKVVAVALTASAVVVGIRLEHHSPAPKPTLVTVPSVHRPLAPPAPFAALSLTPGALDFGRLDIPAKKLATRTVVARNTGPLALRIDPQWHLPAPYKIVAAPCGVLPAGVGKCSITIGFAPERPGRYDGAAPIAVEPHPVRALLLRLRGSAAAAPVAALSLGPRSITFDRVQLPARSLEVRTIEAINVGTLPLLAGIALPASTPFTLAATDCNVLLAPGRTCRVRIAFSPRRPGRYDVTLPVTTSPRKIDAVPPIRLSGVAIAPRVAETPTPRVPVATKTPNPNAPADVNFGQYPLSITGIASRIGCLRVRVENDESAAPAIFAVPENPLEKNWPDLLEDSLSQWVREYPHDFGLPRTLLSLERVYLLTPGDEARARAARIAALLAREYATHPLSREGQRELRTGRVPPALVECHYALELSANTRNH